MSGSNLFKLVLILVYFQFININYTEGHRNVNENAVKASFLPCNFSLNYSTINVSSSASTKTVSVTVYAGTCPWYSESTVSWISTNGSGGSSGSFTFSCSKNTSSSSRTGYVNVSTGTTTKKVKVIQAGYVAPPSRPSSASITYLNGSTKATKPSASSGCTIYWQTSSSGTSTSDAASTKTFTSNTTRYLRQRNTSGLWSSSRTVSVVVYTNPSTPASPSKSYLHGSTTVNKPSAS